MDWPGERPYGYDLLVTLFVNTALRYLNKRINSENYLKRSFISKNLAKS